MAKHRFSAQAVRDSRQVGLRRLYDINLELSLPFDPDLESLQEEAASDPELNISQKIQKAKTDASDLTRSLVVLCLEGATVEGTVEGGSYDGSVSTKDGDNDSFNVHASYVYKNIEFEAFVKDQVVGVFMDQLGWSEAVDAQAIEAAGRMAHVLSLDLMDQQFNNVIPGEAVELSVIATPAAQPEDAKTLGDFDAGLTEDPSAFKPVDV